MTTGMPELGSKISLISKADIRYEGRLFTVDPQECTIALASVRSFGTENRDAQFPVPAQNQVYDYILFRGSDIKDIRIVNNVAPHPQPLNDPAIMQLSVPPSLGGQSFQQHPILGHMTHPPYGSFMPMGGLTTGAAQGLPGNIRSGSSAGGDSKPSELIISPPGGSANVGAPPPLLSPPPPAGEPPRPINDLSDFIGGGAASRSTTPASIGSRKSISVDQGTQAGTSQQRDGNRRQVKPIQPPRGQNQQQQHLRPRSRERRDSQNRPDNQSQGRPQTRGRPYQQQNNQGGYQNHQGGYQNNQGGYQNYNRGGGGWPNSNMRGVPRGRGRPRGAPFRPGAGAVGQTTNNKKSTLKFDSEYDFEQANTEFEELRSKLAKVKLDDAGSSKSEVVNGAVGGGPEAEKKDDSGNETGAGETEQEEDHEIFYDKAKSFFDKISCEAVERAKGKMQKTDWRQERKLNSETFGVAATRRGSYRGRGGFRGGFRGGYRGYNRYPQQRRSSDQPTNQQNQQPAFFHLYQEVDSGTIFTPLTAEEAIANKHDQSKGMDKNDVEVHETNPENADSKREESKIKDGLIVEEKAPIEEALPAKKIDQIAAADPPACVVKP
ncbi:protein LSM14 homolog B-A isoform X1 [Euwallacea similis]|uniref:protein LSM14 homolog B-A isoform X1 n=1 Tax=Euwallacea similis TaxID=1736056 RepID=UPI00344C350A